jgi:hypothetical protein
MGVLLGVGRAGHPRPVVRRLRRGTSDFGATVRQEIACDARIADTFRGN